MLATRTFPVASVERAKEPLRSEPFHAVIQEYFGRAHGASDVIRPVVESPGVHTLLHASRLAFVDHRPLVLSPDAIWLTLVHGLATHINRDPERYRDKLVSHAGELTLRVQTDTLFVPGSLENTWAEDVFPMFSRQIREHVGERMHDLLCARFSTTGKVEQAAFEVALMDVFQAYFHYAGECICGIPEITLEGTVDDWTDLRRRVEAFQSLGLGWWLQALRPILDQFVAAAAGDVNTAFWHDLYQHHAPDNSYGGPYDRMSGWIGALLPYTSYGKNPLIVGETSAYRLSVKWIQFDPFPGTRYAAKPVEPPVTRYPDLGLHYECPVAIRNFSLAVSRVPVEWTFRGGEASRDLSFIAGLIATEQDEQTMALRPSIGWAVTDA